MADCSCVKCQLLALTTTARVAVEAGSVLEVAVAAVSLGSAVLATVAEPAGNYAGCRAVKFPDVWVRAWSEFADAYIWLQHQEGVQLDADQQMLLNLLAYRLGLRDDEGGVSE